MTSRIRDVPLPAFRAAPLRWVLAVCAGFVALQAVFFGLLVAGAAVPNQPIVTHLASDIRKGLYGPPILKDRMGGNGDGFTECVIVGTGLGGPSDNPVSRAAVMPRIYSCPEGKAQILRLANGEPVVTSGYFRYWAGYTVLTRPVLALSGIAGVRVVGGALLVLSIVMASLALTRTVGALSATALLGPLVAGTNITSTPSTGVSQAFSIATYVAAVAICAWAAKRSARLGVLAVALGAAVFCYVDLLTTPAVAWALTTATVGAVVHREGADLRRTSATVLASAVAWPVTFGATWVARWAIAVPFVGFSRVRADVVDKILFRTEGGVAHVDLSFGATTRRNVSYWLHEFPTSWAVVWIALAGVIVAAVVLGMTRRSGLLTAGVLSVVALVVPLWYEVLRSHSQIHTPFTYRGVAAAVGVVLFAFVSTAVGARSRPTALPPATEESAPVATTAAPRSVSGLSPSSAPPAHLGLPRP